MKESDAPVMSLEEINHFLKTVRFRRSLLGVSEADVWRKLAQLSELYEKELQAERVRIETLRQLLTDLRGGKDEASDDSG